MQLQYEIHPILKIKISFLSKPPVLFMHIHRICCLWRIQINKWKKLIDVLSSLKHSISDNLSNQASLIAKELTLILVSILHSVSHSIDIPDYIMYPYQITITIRASASMDSVGRDCIKYTNTKYVNTSKKEGANFPQIFS